MLTVENNLLEQDLCDESRSGCESEGSTSGSNSGTGTGTDSDSESDSESDSDSAPIERPIFIRKKAARVVTQKDNTVPVHIPIARAPSPSLEFAEFDGIDDTDDLDPEMEFMQWQQRNDARAARDRETRAQAEAEKDDLLRRYVPHS